MPVIAVDVGNIEIACKQYGEECLRAIEMSILHEIGHALQEAAGKEFNEDEAEDFAHEYYYLNRIQEI